jgi:hypothetical protein
MPTLDLPDDDRERPSLLMQIGRQLDAIENEGRRLYQVAIINAVERDLLELRVNAIRDLLSEIGSA